MRLFTATSTAKVAYSFNPHPAWRPGATSDGKSVKVTVPEFQSSPGLEAGCDVIALGEIDLPRGFNPHPAWRPGATQHGTTCATIEPVSILTRLGGRVRHETPALSSTFTSFQSSPGLEAGCDARIVTCDILVHSFNPHPAWRPGATLPVVPRWAVGSVSILTRLGGRVRRWARSTSSTWKLFQSSPGLEAGCDIQAPRIPAVRYVSILTRLGGRVRRVELGQE